MVEHHPFKVAVLGSSPSALTNKKEKGKRIKDKVGKLFYGGEKIRSKNDSGIVN